jgi:hypothetical protein
MLKHFQFGEFNETYMKDYLENITPFAHYRDLFTSNSFRNIKLFIWENPVCSNEELLEIKKIMKEIQFLVIRWSSEWIR